ncbi:MAG: hydroxymethylbilane synthase [Bilifractor sp.]
MKKKKIIIGSRESQLAVVQSRLVIRYLNENHPEVETELLTMKTTGDKILDRRLDQIGGKGLFVKELDKALIEHRSDFSVHSLKDLPMEVSESLPIVAYSRREDPRDVLVLPKGKTEIDFSKPIGTSSLRRILQLKKLFPDAAFESVRGNLQTRLRKLDEGQYSAIILAAAGMKRMGLAERISRYFSVDEVIPSAGQAILAVQGRKDEDASVFDGFRDEDATLAAIAERAFVRYLNGGCSSPIAAHATIFENADALPASYKDAPTLQLLENGLPGDDLPDDYSYGNGLSDIDVPDDSAKLIYLRGLYYNEENGAVRTGAGIAPAGKAERLGVILAKKLQKEAAT